MPSKDFSALAKAHDDWRLKRCINLIPSENIMSPTARALLSSDLASRYSLPINDVVHGAFVENAYRGTRYSDEITISAERLACEAFGARHVSLAPLSGHVAAILMLSALCRKGDTVMSLSSSDGGYDGYCKKYIPDMLGLGTRCLPFDQSLWNIDVEAACAAILRFRPRLVVLGASYLPFPHPVRELSEACATAGAFLGYDAAHVLGILPSFQQPLREGADIVVANTHKTFWGPQGGLAMANDPEIDQAVRRNLTWRTLDNTHLNRIAATGQALLEYKRHGKAYAAQVVKNSRALAAALDGGGFPVRFKKLGYTRSHQILLGIDGMKKMFRADSNTIAKRLERYNVITDAVGRLGTQEVTRMGLRERDMKELAELIFMGASGENIGKGVRALRKRMKLCYVLKKRGD
ncbi:MAG: serine hydroxymethyltransferase [Euryarchaeota archaeon]|nr:serine hydroxymethyltransferase [Euryarchaeota archaeon]